MDAQRLLNYPPLSFAFISANLSSGALGLVHTFAPSVLIVVLTCLLPLLLLDRAVTGVVGRAAWYNTFFSRVVVLSLILLPWTWLAQVNVHVPEAYLDEVFHVPQAKRYLEGKWLEWDDKITTPPGLYLISWILLKLEAAARFLTPGIGAADLTDPTASLRENNAFAILFVAGLAAWCHHLIRLRHVDGATNQRGEEDRLFSSPGHVSAHTRHTALNIALFPILFFFSGLYYTDLWSTVAVLWAYRHHLSRTVAADRGGCSARPSSLRSDILVVVYGVVALWMRQTNVFWVVVYFGGLEAIHAVKMVADGATDGVTRLEKSEQRAIDDDDFPDVRSAARAYLKLYASGNIHDPPLETASFYDVLWLPASVAVAITYNLPRVLRQVWPHFSVLALFGGFVAWNGGVVLGDKSNHIATLHPAQMLYIWPLFLFFSAPLLLSHVRPMLATLRQIPQGRESNRGPRDHDIKPRSGARVQQHKRPHRPARVWPPRLLRTISDHCWSGWLPLWYVSLPLAAVIVWKGTIVHPFTLADNRHYMFYVFRYTIRKHNVRYPLAPVYVVCHRLCWRLLCGSSPSVDPSSVDNGSGGHPQRQRWVNAPCSIPVKSTGSSNAASRKSVVAAASYPHAEPLSTALLWLLATALSLMTAPLVEPRYFIVPWVTWRLLVPPTWDAAAAVDGAQVQEPTEQAPAEQERVAGFVRRYVLSAAQDVMDELGTVLDPVLVLETLWFAAVNLATMYMFLYRPYQWRDVDGRPLDGGRLQRFMW